MGSSRREFCVDMLDDIHKEMLKVSTERPTKQDMVAHMDYWATVIKSVKTILEEE